MIRTIFKTITLASLLAGATYVGDKYQPITKTTEQIKFFKVPAGENTPKDYLNWKLQPKIENDQAYLYIQSEDFSKKFSTKMLEPTIGEKIDSYIQNNKVLNYYQNEWKTFKNNVKQQFE